MCERAIQLCDEIIVLLNQESELDKDHLIVTDWGYLIDIRDFLKPFRLAIKLNEGIFDAIDRVLPGMEFLLEHLERAKTTYRRNRYMAD